MVEVRLPLPGCTLAYSQTTGELRTADGELVAKGWAGHGAGKNNPAMQAAHSVGPLPQGRYSVGPWESLHAGLGPMVARLTQVDGETFGRDGFYIHGPALDPIKHGEESKGCIVIPRPGREEVKNLNPAFVEVGP